MAEHRAAHNALLSLFLVKETGDRILPTEVQPTQEREFVPNTAAAGNESLHSLAAASRQAL